MPFGDTIFPCPRTPCELQSSSKLLTESRTFPKLALHDVTGLPLHYPLCLDFRKISCEQDCQAILQPWVPPSNFPFRPKIARVGEQDCQAIILPSWSPKRKLVGEEVGQRGREQDCQQSWSSKGKLVGEQVGASRAR